MNTGIVKRLAWSAALAAATLTACRKGKGGDPRGAGAGGMPPMPVEVAVARVDTVLDEIAATGQIDAMQQVDLRPEVDGRIVDILVREGQEVAKGEALFKVDDAELKAQVAQLAAQKDLANQDLERTKQLVAQNASSAADLERAEAQARSTTAQYELQSIRLERTTVRAPFAGVVGRRAVSLGDYVTSSTPLITLQTVNPQRATFQVPERYAQALKVGQRVSFRVGAIAGRDFDAEVDFVDPVVQLPGRTILVKARAPNNQRLLQPGMFIEAHLVTAVRPKAVVVPEEAIVPMQGATLVWVVAEGKVTQRQVGIGVRTPGTVEITSGLDGGEQVVVGGQERLFPGAPVMPKVVERGAPAVPAEH